MSFLRDGVQPDPVSETAPFIPRRIWQTTKDINEIKPQLRRCTEALSDINPGWEYRIFDDNSQRDLLARVCSDRFMRAYDRLQPQYGAARADLFRYIVIYLYGGAYFDLKSGVIRPLDSILRDDDLFIISQWDNGPNGKFPGVGMHRRIKDIPGGEYEQWFVLSAPGHPYLANVITRVLQNIEGYNAFRFGHGGSGLLTTIGPYAYTRAIREEENLGLHRKICAWDEGLRYTMFDNLYSHQRIDEGHYRKKMLPPVTAHGLHGLDLFRYWLGEIGYWPISVLRYWNYRRLGKRRSKRPGHGKIPLD